MADKSDPFQSSSREFGSDLLADEDDTEKKKKRLQALMNRLKMKSTRLGTLMECAQNYGKTILDKRTQNAIDVSQLDILQQHFSACTLPLMLDRLSMCARHADLTFSKMKSPPSTNNRLPYWSASIGTDRFQVEIQISHKVKVEEVFVSLMQVSDGVVPRRNPVLLKILRNNEFEQFTDHLRGYANIYKPIVDRTKNHLCFVVLGAMESNIEALAHGQMVSTANQICHSSVGNITPRNAGLPLKSTYFIGPYDLLIPKSSTNYPAEAIKEKNIGQSFTLELRSSNPHPFFVKPIYANNKSLDGTSSLVETNQKEWIELPAVFVMKLKQALPISRNTLKQIQSATEVEFKGVNDYEPLLPLIISNAIHNKDNKPNNCDHIKHQKSVYLPGWKHHYYIGDDSSLSMQDSQTPNDITLQGCIVDAIPFITANCIVQVIALLRKQTAFNAVIESCVRQPNTGSHNAIIGKTINESVQNPDVKVFQVNSESLSRISVIFEDPVRQCLSSCDFDMSDLECLKCQLFSSMFEDNEICSNAYLSQVFQRSLSLPITMRAILRKANEKIILLNKEKINPIEPVDASERVVTERLSSNPMLASLLDDTTSKTCTPICSPPQPESPQSPCPSKKRKYFDTHTSPLSSAALLLTAHKRPIKPPPPPPPPPPIVSAINSQPLRVPPLPFDHTNNINQNEITSFLKHHSSSEIESSPLRLPTYTTNPLLHNANSGSNPSAASNPPQSNGLTSPNWTATTPQSSIASPANFHSRVVSEPTANASGDTRFKGGGVNRSLVVNSTSDRKSLNPGADGVGVGVGGGAVSQAVSDPFDFNASCGVQASIPSPADGLTASDSISDVLKKEVRPLSTNKTKSALTVKLNTKLLNKDASMPSDSASMKRPRSRDASTTGEEELSAKAAHKKQKLLAKQMAMKKRRCDTSPSDKKRETIAKLSKTTTSRVYDFDGDMVDSVGSVSNDAATPPDTPPKLNDTCNSRAKTGPPKIKISGGRVHLSNSNPTIGKSKDKSKNTLNNLPTKSRSKDTKEAKSALQTCYNTSSAPKSSSKTKQIPNHSLQKTTTSSPSAIVNPISNSNNNSKLDKPLKTLSKELAPSPTGSNGSDSKPAPIRNRKSSLTAVIDKLTKTKQITPSEKQSKISDKQSKQTITPADEGPKTKASADMIRLMILSQGNLPSTPPKDGTLATTSGTVGTESGNLLTQQITPPVGKVPLAKIPSRAPISVPITTSPTMSNNLASKPAINKESTKSATKESKTKVPNLLSSNSFNNSSNNNKSGQPKYSNSVVNSSSNNHRTYQSNQHRNRQTTVNPATKNPSDQTSPPRASLLPTPGSHFDPSRPSPPPLAASKPIAPYQRASYSQSKPPVSILKNSVKRDPAIDRLSNGDARKSPSNALSSKNSLQPILPPASNSNPASPIQDEADAEDEAKGHQSTVLAQPLHNNSPECSPRDSDDDDEDAFFIDVAPGSPQVVAGPASPADNSAVEKFASLHALDKALSPPSQVCREEEILSHSNNSVMISEKS